MYPVVQKQEPTVCAPGKEAVNWGHPEHVVAAVAEYAPTEQLLHIALPDMDLCFPAAHAVHMPPSGPVYPTLQVQPVETLHPLHNAPELAAQARHVVAAVAAVVVE